MSTSDEKHAPDLTAADQGTEPKDAAAEPTPRDDEAVHADPVDEHARGGIGGATPGSPITTPASPAADLAKSPKPAPGTVPDPGTKPTPAPGTSPVVASPTPVPVPEPGPPAAPPVLATPAARPATGPGSVAPPASPPAAPPVAAPAAPPVPAQVAPPVSPPAAPPVPAQAAPVRPPLSAEDEATARHSAGRPLPVPPGPPTTPIPPGAAAPSGSAAATGAVGATTAAGAAAAGAAAGAAAAGSIAGAGSPTPMADSPAASGKPSGSSPDLFPDPNAPRTITVGTHALGVIVGILLPLASMLVTMLGIARILAVEADGWAAKVDVLGIVLVTLGALLLLACALLSLWTPSVGLVGGSILTLAGGFALYAPGLTRTGVLHVLSSEGWQPTVVQSVVVATSGTVVVVGILLLGSGIVSTTARRHGIRLGAFRERHRA